MDGGGVTLVWRTNGASSLTLDPGAAPLTPVAAGSTTLGVFTSTAFMLTAKSAAGSARKTAMVVVACDASPGTPRGTCDVPSASQCVDFANLSTADVNSL
jgi:hypothetical protein